MRWRQVPQNSEGASVSERSQAGRAARAVCGDQASLRLTLGCRARGRLRRDGGVARGLKWGWGEGVRLT